MTPHSVKKILDSIQNKKILVIGDVGVDQYTLGKVDRISPEAPIPIVAVENEMLKLGLAGNVADNICTFGAKAYLVGVVGNDLAAQQMKELILKARSEGGDGEILDHLVIESHRKTILKQRIVSDRQQLLRVDYESSSSIDEQTRKNLFEKIEEQIPLVDGVILEDYAKGILDEAFIQKVFAMARKYHKKVAVDPNRNTPVDFYRGAFLLTPNTQEAEALSKVNMKTDEDVLRAGQFILEKTQAEFLLITRGKQGMALFSHQNPSLPQWIPTSAREVYDVSGAGDTVISLVTLAFIAGVPLSEGVVLANLAAGIKVGKRGTATVSPQEILTFLAKT